MEHKDVIEIPVFGYGIVVIFTDDFKETLKTIRKEKGYEITNVDGSTGAFHFKVPDYSETYLVFPVDTDLYQIPHESYHAVCGMLSWLSVAHDEELVAYCLGYINKKVHEIWEEAKKKHKIVKKYKKLVDKSK